MLLHRKVSRLLPFEDVSERFWTLPKWGQAKDSGHYLNVGNTKIKEVPYWQNRSCIFAELFVVEAEIPIQ